VRPEMSTGAAGPDRIDDLDVLRHAKVGGYNGWLRGLSPMIATLSIPSGASGSRVPAVWRRGMSRHMQHTGPAAYGCGPRVRIRFAVDRHLTQTIA
jgi:hypothetical protein